MQEACFFSGQFVFSRIGLGALCVLGGERLQRFTARMALRTRSGVNGNSFRRAPVAL